MSKTMLEQLKFHIKSLSRFIFVVTEDEDAFMAKVGGILKDHLERTKVYNPTVGWSPYAQYTEEIKSGRLTNGATSQINEALTVALRDNPEEKVFFYIVLDPERFMARDPHVVRRYLNIIQQQHSNIDMVKIFIFVSNTLAIPEKLNRYATVIRDTGLSDAEIQERLEMLSEKLRLPTPSSNLHRVFRGLTEFQIDQSVAQSVIHTRTPSLKANEPDPNRRIDPTVITKYKRDQMNKSSLLEYMDSDEGFDQVGGLDRFKRWAEETQACWTAEGQKFGLRPPRGVLAVGVHGCGKSVSTKALASTWKLPLVRLDMGRLRSSGVGDTESNVYRIISIVEAVAPCILWADEAEKNFSGTESSSQSDAGTTSRMLGIFSTWLQETKAHVCLAMTVNKLRGLPPELVSRATERFFFDIPSHEERIDILKIHLRKVRRDPSKFDLNSLAEASEDLVGRELEQSIEAALRQSFHRDFEDLDFDILRTELKTRPRLLRTAEDDLSEIIHWVGYDPDVDDGVRARLASSKRSEAFGRIVVK